jgi:hypothetical protein
LQVSFCRGSECVFAFLEGRSRDENQRAVTGPERLEIMGDFELTSA